MIFAVAHTEFKELGAERIRGFGGMPDSVLYDLEYLLSTDVADFRFYIELAP